MPRNRWMYYATGLPGWMRFGFSPGWWGRSPTGLGPCATYMMTGAWGTPQAQAYWDAVTSGTAPAPWSAPVPFTGMHGEDELGLLKQQAGMLSNQLDQVKKRISDLESEREKSQGQGGDAR
jgi:hypothetical protein